MWFRTLLQWALGLGQIGLIVAIVIGAGVVSQTLGRGDGAEPSRPPLAEGPRDVFVFTPQAGSYRSRVKTTGVVEVRARIPLSAQVGGRVETVSERFKSGALVSEGDVLATIDSADFEIEARRASGEIGQARAALVEIEAEAALAREEWFETVGERPISPLAALEPQVDAARARLESAIAVREAAELAIQRSSITSPATGRIVLADLRPGQVVRANDVFGELYALSDVELAITVSPAELALLAPIEGRSIAVPDRPGLTASVDRVDAVLDPRTRLATIRGRIEESGSATLGDFFELSIAGDEIPGLLALPASSVRADGSVYVIKRDEVALRNVSLVGREGATVFVEPFDTADGVIEATGFRLRAGDIVNPLRREPLAEAAMAETTDG